MPINLEIREGRRWHLVEGGPFPITVDQLDAARDAWAAQRTLDAGDPLGQTGCIPQTVARQLLEEHAPQVRGVDRLALGFVVTASKYRLTTEGTLHE